MELMATGEGLKAADDHEGSAAMKTFEDCIGSLDP